MNLPNWRLIYHWNGTRMRLFESQSTLLTQRARTSFLLTLLLLIFFSSILIIKHSLKYVFLPIFLNTPFPPHFFQHYCLHQNLDTKLKQTFIIPFISLLLCGLKRYWAKNRKPINIRVGGEDGTDKSFERHISFCICICISLSVFDSLFVYISGWPLGSTS